MYNNLKDFRPKDFFPDSKKDFFQNTSAIDLLKLTKKSGWKKLLYNSLTILVIIGTLTYLIIGYTLYSEWMIGMAVGKMVIAAILLCVLFQGGALKCKRDKKMIENELSKRGYTL